MSYKGKRIELIDVEAGKVVKSMRKMFNITQDVLAKQIGVTAQQLHKYETGIDRISVAMIYKIACVFHCDIGMFFPTREKKENKTNLLKVAERTTKFNYRTRNTNNSSIELLKIFFKLPADKQEKLVEMAKNMTSDK